MLNSTPILSPEIPKFSVCGRFFPRRYYVMAKWKDGRVSKIARFTTRGDAAYWIEEFSDLWVQGYLGKRDGMNST